jgi:hypothetical protein
MKRLVLFFAIASLLLMPACTTKFNIAAPYKNITVIYGLLDEADPVHYVRIEKAFLSQDKSSLTMAKVADSSFFPLLDVRIKRLDFSGNYIDTIHLTKVDLDTVAGYQKKPGIFFTTPNYAYQFFNTLSPYYIYRILVTNPATGETDSADAPVIDDMNYQHAVINSFYISDIDDSELNKAGIDFASTLPNKNYILNVIYTPADGFNFEGLNGPEYIADVIFRFHWVDSNVATQTIVRDSFDYDAGIGQLNNNTLQFLFSHYSFYSAIASGMGVAPANTYRLMGRIGLFVYLGSQDYNSYYQNALTQGLGLTGNEIEPSYTNVSGGNTLGLFTSRGYRYSPITITFNTIDSLGQNPITQSAKIVGTYYH